ncbi:MAG: 4Fe-4S dicluster domain-containing protein [Bacteroidales bacterium]|nr:4Fe-4S dicluster domain-containing protein [Deltaproteobacteria bacterium]MBN2665912.1 4Fe-4S dicluster domain-containing protein [Bacteroidales bacterium]
MARIKIRTGPAGIRLISTLLATLLALPLTWGIFTGFYLWLSPFIMFNAVLTLKGFIFLNTVALAVLVTAFLKKRFFCVYLCPVGYTCDTISRVSPLKASCLKKIPDISQWIALISITSAAAGLPLFILLDPLALFHGFFTSLAGNSELAGILALAGFPLLLALHYFFPNLWCAKLCPLGGLQNIAWDLRSNVHSLFSDENESKRGFSAGRRYLISAGAGLAAGLFLPKQINPYGKPLIRPPGSVPEDTFNTLCIRCGNCIRSCPTKILFHDINTSRLISFMTPEVRFNKGYCLEDCNLCSMVCPSGSISLFDTKDKKQIIMGKAEIELDKCWLSDNRECNRCQISCRYDALAIGTGEIGKEALPVIDPELCTGCGACAVICPPGAIKINPVETKDKVKVLIIQA